MLAEGLPVFVEESGVGSFQIPNELRGIALAGIDLVAFRMNLEKQLFVGGRLKLLQNLLRGRKFRQEALFG